VSPAGAVLLAIAVAALSGLPGVFLPAGRRAGERIAVALLWLSTALAVWGLWGALWTGATSRLSWPWAVPGGAFSVKLDALAAFFLLPVFTVPVLGATSALESWAEAAHPESGRRLRLVYGLMVAGLGLVMVAGNGVVFLVGWEVMALAAFLAVGTEDHLPEVRAASYLYLALTRVSTLCLFAFFALLHRATGTFDLEPVKALAQGEGTALFLLALVGFGLKAGLMPLHVWLPGAHAAAPSHVSAVMSGVLIKVGIYGLVRVLALLPPAPPWWGLTLLVGGAVSAVLGVAYALGQHDLKRLLAYHSIENVGIIVLGLAVATLGRSFGRQDLVVLGLAGCLLHVWNHGLFKSLLFLSGGAVVHACHTRELDHLGGLARRMPRVSALFLLGAVAICGLPPLNGFVSELYVYLGLFAAVRPGGAAPWLLAALAAAALALVGGLALACFAKVHGVVFLGSPRTEAAAAAREPGATALAPMGVLAAACVAIGAAPIALAPALDACAAAVAPGLAGPLTAHAPVAALSGVAVALALGLGAGAALYRALVRRAGEAEGLTWDCGQPAPTARMQYTASSFAGWLVDAFGWALRPEVVRGAVLGPFPGRATYASHVGDAVLDGVLRPLVGLAVQGFGRLRWVQAGNLSLYLAFVGLALVAALAWLQGVP
jgi:hydrogenase-4 component B